MTILCFYGYVCEDPDAIDDGHSDERPIRGLQIDARPICNVQCRKPGMCVVIASGTHAAANASHRRRTSTAGNARSPSYRSVKSFDVRNTCPSVRDAFTQRPSVRRAADALRAPAYRFRKTLVGPGEA
ncbi:hypothetical protein [Burkholderia sp. Z1]|uniref:hypothetical protein n=1 Tax=Burkholderia sp. Z1 TaxID=2759039 RepID=UPI0018663909|nr:hypothetical protein [Burkholderia sp. Z1]